MYNIAHKRLLGVLARLFIVIALTVTLSIPQQAVASTSGGSGGVYTNQYNLSFTGGGFTSKYHLFAQGIDPTKPIGLVLNFHGDGAYGFNNPNSTYSLDADGDAGTVKVARDYNMITVSILTPDRATGDYTWWWRGANYADFVYALVNNLYTKYDVDKTRIWFDGYSGGAQFITQYYVSEYGGSGQFENGGALMFGGGDTPQSGDPQPGTVNPIPDSVKQNFRMWWGAGTKDLADRYWNGGLDSAQKGEAYYRSIGFVNTSHYYPEGWCHDTSSTCQSFEYQFAPYLRQQLSLAYPQTSPTPTLEPTVVPTVSVPPTGTPATSPTPSTIPTSTPISSPTPTAPVLPTPTEVITPSPTTIVVPTQTPTAVPTVFPTSTPTPAPTITPTPVIDITSPTVSVTASPVSAVVGRVVTLSANAVDDIGVTKVEFYRGTTKLGEDMSSPFTYSWNTVGQAARTYDITAKAYDSANNVGTSSPIKFSILSSGVSVDSYSYLPMSTGVTFNIKTSKYARKVLIRVSRNPLTGQTGFYEYNPTDANGIITLTLLGELTSNTLYYYQIEVNGVIIQSTKGTFTTL